MDAILDWPKERQQHEAEGIKGLCKETNNEVLNEIGEKPCLSMTERIYNKEDEVFYNNRYKEMYGKTRIHVNNRGDRPLIRISNGTRSGTSANTTQVVLAAANEGLEWGEGDEVSHRCHNKRCNQDDHLLVEKSLLNTNRDNCKGASHIILPDGTIYQTCPHGE